MVLGTSWLAEALGCRWDVLATSLIRLPVKRAGDTVWLVAASRWGNGPL